MTSARRRPRRVPFRLGFAVEVLGQGWADVVTPWDLRALVEGATRPVGRAEERTAALAA